MPLTDVINPQNQEDVHESKLIPLVYDMLHHVKNMKNTRELFKGHQMLEPPSNKVHCYRGSIVYSHQPSRSIKITYVT